MTRAIVYVPSGDFDPHAARCTAFSEERGYDLKGIVRDDWESVKKMMQNGEVSVVLVAVDGHLDPNRTPRIEVVAEQSTNQPASRWEKRTRVIRRGEGG